MLHKIVLVWILFVIASYSQANVWYYGSGEAVNLENNIGFDKHGQKIITGDTDAPNVVAKSAAKGSIYLQLGGGVFYKTDNGSSTNWSLIPGSYSGTAPINISGTTISCDTATSLVPGCLSAADWSTFNSKVGGSGTAGQVSYWDGASSQAGENDFTWDATNNILTAEKLKTAYSYPAADSVTALQTRKADGATIVTNIDTTNSTFRIGTGALGTATNSQFQVKGLDNGLTASRTAMTFGNGGYAAPSNLNTESNGDKWVFWNSNTYKGAIGFDSYEMWFQSTSTAPASTNKFRFFGGQASAPVDLLKFGTGSSLGYIWNESGLDLDYRLEGDTDSNMFFLDASTDKLGLGNNSPDFKLDVNGDIRVQDAFKLYFGGTGDADNDVNLYRSALNLLKTDDSFETVEMRLASNSQVTAIQGSPAASASATYYMPPADGGANSVLSTNGAGTLSWATPVLTLDNLTDVILTSPVTSQILQYNGTDWINVPYVAPVASGGVSLFLDDTANAHFGAGYITLSQAPVAGATDTDTINTTTANVEVQYGLPTAYATTNALGVTSIPAGMWDLRLYADVDSAVGVSTMRVEVIKKATGGAETVLFSFVTPEMNSSTPTLISVDYAAPAIAVLATDYLAVRVYAVSTSANRTFRFYHNGTTQYTNISTPLGNAHNFLDGLQGCATNECYHLSSAEKTGTGTGNFVRETSPTIATPTITTSATIPTVQGSTTASGNLTIRSTSNATKGTVSVDSNTELAAGKTLALQGSSSGKVTLQTAATAGTYSLTLPTDDGNANEVLQTDGSGVLSWVAQVSGANTALSNLATVAINTSLVSDTDNADDLGSSSASWKDLYTRTVKFDGSTSGTVTMQAASTAGTYSLTLPDNDGNANEALITNGSGVLSWGSPSAVDTSDNAQITTAVNLSDNELTVYVKNPAGNDPSAGSPVYVKVRTAAGTYATRTITSALSMIFSKGATMGHKNGKTHKIWVYLVDSDGSGTMKLALTTTKIVNLNVPVSTTANTDAADTNNVLYGEPTTGAYSNKYAACIGYITSTQTTAGLWAAAVTAYSGKSAVETPDVIKEWYASAGGVTFTNAVAKDFVYETTTYTSHGAYDTTTGIFTAPESGIYEVEFSFSFDSWAANGVFLPVVSGSTSYNGAMYINRTVAGYGSFSDSTMIQLAKNGTTKVRLTIDNGANRVTTGSTSYNNLKITKIGEIP